jgi:hypothetical protein
MSQYNTVVASEAERRSRKKKKILSNLYSSIDTFNEKFDRYKHFYYNYIMIVSKHIKIPVLLKNSPIVYDYFGLEIPELFFPDLVYQ